jgi:hypothetical protein
MNRSIISGLAVAIAAVRIASASPANADGIDDATSDVIFRAGLTDLGVLFNFPLEKRQGQRYCQALIDGAKPLDAVYDLMRDGGYPFDIANGITSAASIAYCECTDSALNGNPVHLRVCSSFELNQPRRRF